MYNFNIAPGKKCSLNDNLTLLEISPTNMRCSVHNHITDIF
uniref:Uncharacterized protein n=1 Tax=Anguilla anguilla TaxID=7936 RepID=A0A0E9U1X3_ANGAN